MKTGSTGLITGATGMIGGALARRILKESLCDRLVLPVRNIAKAERIYGDLETRNREKLCFVQSSMENLRPEQFPAPIDYIIHCACVTQSAQMAACPVETADSIVMGTKAILELARNKQVKSMVYLSSMEVYGKVEDTGRLVSEEQLGEVDLQAPRSCYPMGKRMAEHYCHIYYQEYHVPVKIARLAQTFGRGVRPEDNRVYMQFARSACEGRDIVLKTQGTSMGNYCDIDDAVEGILTILCKGRDGEAYNVVNEANTMTVREMAQLVAAGVMGGRIGVKVEAADAGRNGYAPDTGVRLSGEKLRALGWKPRKGLEDMYKDVIKDMKRL